MPECARCVPARPPPPCMHPASSRVFLLGPSHHHYTRKCLLSTAQSYQTPLGKRAPSGWA